MSSKQQSLAMARADSEDENYEYEVQEEDGEEEQEEEQEDEQEQQSDEESEKEEDDEDEEEEQDKSLVLLPLVMQHGAHRNWQLRAKHHVHKAKGGLPVQDGRELGNLIGSRSGKVWSRVQYNHVDLIGGEPLQGGEQQLAPHVRFLPPEGSPTSDDAIWLRPVHAKVMEFLQPLWIENINKIKCAEKRERVREYYAPVLEWKASQLKGPRLDPVAMGTGDLGFAALSRQLKTIAVRPPVQPRKTAEGGEQPVAKKQKCSSSVDTESVAEDCPFVSLGEGSRIWRLGEVGRVVVNNGIDGNVYASLLP